VQANANANASLTSTTVQCLQHNLHHPPFLLTLSPPLRQSRPVPKDVARSYRTPPPSLSPRLLRFSSSAPFRTEHPHSFGIPSEFKPLPFSHSLWRLCYSLLDLIISLDVSLDTTRPTLVAHSQTLPPASLRTRLRIGLLPVQSLQQQLQGCLDAGIGDLGYVGLAVSVVFPSRIVFVQVENTRLGVDCRAFVTGFEEEVAVSDKEYECPHFDSWIRRLSDILDLSHASRSS